MSRLRTGTWLAIVALVTAIAGEAWAVDRHERVSVRAMMAKGQAVGARIKLTLRPESYTAVRIGLGRMAADAAAKAHAEKDSKLRLLASGDHPGYLRYKFPQIDGLVQNQPKEIELELKYGEGNDLKAGEKVDLVSAWHGGTTKVNFEGQQVQYWHIYGMYDGPVNQGDESSVLTLPDK